MRGLLKCFLRQREKIERFKETNDPADSIHAKFCTHTGLPVSIFDAKHVMLFEDNTVS